VNNPYFGGMFNYRMPVSGSKYGQNAMQLPGAYGGDPYSVGGGGAMGYSGPFAQPLPESPQFGMQQMMGFQQPLMRNRGMRPFRGQNALNNMYGQMPSPYASVE